MSEHPRRLPDFAALTGELGGRGASSALFSSLDDASLIDSVEAITRLRHEVERWQALAAAEVARRSRVGFGVRGLARRAGHASTGHLLQSITRASRRETAALIAVGDMIGEADAATELTRAVQHDPELADSTPLATGPWFAELGRAVAGGVLTVTVADALRSGLGDPGGDADAALMAAAVPALIAAARDLDADAARRMARQVRDRIDASGVVARARQQRNDQFWRVWVKPDGMVRGEFELEPHDGMLVKAVFDQLTHPRRTDERLRRSFGHPVAGDAAHAEARAGRARRAAEGLTQLIRAGASVDPGRLLDERKPSVRLVVNANALATASGSGAIEGHPDRIPLSDIHTGLCAGYLPIRFDHAGAVLDLGRDERLFTEKQKVALAVRDGGCMDPDCTRPPSWTEAHHIDHWRRDHGRTDLADGILLCRRDHLRYHNEGWEVRREGPTYWLIPPSAVDPERRPRPMRSKTPADVINPFDPIWLPRSLVSAEPRERARDRTGAA